MVLFFYGENTFALRAKVKELIGKYRSKLGNDFGLERFDGSMAEAKNEAILAEKITSSLTNLPMFGSSRLIIIEDILVNKQLTEGVISNLENIPSTTVVIFVETKVDKRMASFKQLVKLAKSKEFKNLTHPQLLTWAEKTVAEYGGSISSTALSLLLVRAGEDQWRLENEIIKLINFKPEINEEAIRQMVEPELRSSIFDLLEALSSSQIDRALSIYADLRASKAQPIYILSMLGWQMRNLIIVKAASLENPAPSANQIAKDFKMSPFVIQKAGATVRDIGYNNLKSAHSLLIAADYRLKTSSVDSDLLIEQLIEDTAAVLSR